MKRGSQKLLALGALLFLLGLLSGFAIPAMTNPRMGLSSHLEGVMNGMFLMLVALAWDRFQISSRSRSLAFWSLLYGTYANWIFVQISALLGTSEMTPIAGAGHRGLPWQEFLVSAGLVSVGLAMVLGCGLLVWGAFRQPEEH